MANKNTFKQVVNCKKGGKNTCAQKEIVPVVLVPGIMGSYLAQDGVNIWDPDAGSGGTSRALAMANRYMGARERTARKMITATVSVGKNPNFALNIGKVSVARIHAYDNRTKDALAAYTNAKRSSVLSEHNQAQALWEKYKAQLDGRSAFIKAVDDVVTEASRRAVFAGWAEVASDFYLDFLLECQEHKFAHIESGHTWAIGYTWNYSNWDSANIIHDGIRNMFRHYKEKYPKRKVSRCIIVTHSMGGLVTRAAMKRFAYMREHVHLVVQTVAPNNGAPQAYRRMITGFTHGGWKLTQLLGPDGRSVRTLAAAVPSLFELLPNNRYERDTQDTADTWKNLSARGRPKKWLKWNVPAEFGLTLGSNKDQTPEVLAKVRALIPARFAKWYFITKPARNVYAHYGSKIRPTGAGYWNIHATAEPLFHRSVAYNNNANNPKRWLLRRYFYFQFQKEQRGYGELKSPKHELMLERKLKPNAKAADKFHKRMTDASSSAYMPARFALITSDEVSTEIAVELHASLRLARPTSEEPEKWDWSVASYGVTAKEVRQNAGDGTVPLVSQRAGHDRAEFIKPFKGVVHDAIMNAKAAEIVAVLDLYALKSRAPRHKKGQELT